MKRLTQILSLLMALSILAAALGGCAGGKPENEEPSKPEDASPSAQARANEIFVGIAQDLDDSLDPHKMTAAGTREVLFNVFEGLVKPDKDGNLIPAVAERYEIDETGDTFTFTLREGVQFHDGSPVTVWDVSYSISRAAGLGINPGEALVSSLSIIQSVVATADGTIVIKTHEPNIELLAFLAQAHIIPEDSDPSDGLIGTGPFRFVSRTAQENVIIEKFEDYWGKAAHLDRVTFKIIENADSLIMALRSGAIDMCAHLTASQAAELSGFQILEGTMNLVQALYLNNDYGPLADVRVRQAISYAIDSQEIMDFISDGRGTALGSSMYPAFGKYFMPELTDYYATDIEAATQLLADAGYENGFELEIAAPSNYQPHVDTAVVVVDQLARIGITATIRLVDWETWRVDVYGERNYQATVCGFDASTLTASALLSRFVSGNSRNISAFSDAEFDRIFAEAAAETDEARQVQLYKELQTILSEQAANAYIQDICDLVAMRSDLTGYEFYPLYVLDMAKVRFAD